MKRLLIFSLLLALLRPGVLHAQASQDTADLEGLLDQSVVSAPSKSDETTSTAPATTVSISADDLKRHGIRTVDEAINFLAMGMVTDKAFQTAGIGTRGVSINGDFGGHVLLMVDGHVISEPWGATAYFDRGTAIPFELIDHIELVLGPGSVLYGSNAMLGIVNIVTRRAKDFSGAHLVLDSEIPVSLRGAAGFGREFKLFDRDAELTFEAEYYERKGPTYDFPLRDGGVDSLSNLPHQYSREQPPNIWGGPGNDAYYTHAPSAYMRLRVGNFDLGVRGALYDRTYPTDSGDFDDPKSHEVDRWFSVDLKHRLTVSETVQLSTRLYADHYDYREYWNSHGAIDCLPGQNACDWYLEGVTNWMGLEPQVSLDWSGDKKFVTLIGVDGRIKQVKSREDYTDLDTGINPGSVGAYDRFEKALAPYVQQTLTPAPWVAVNAGARVDIDDRFGSHLSPRAAATFFPWRGGALKAIYSEAFRAPTSFELYYQDPRTQVAGGNLRPEVVRSVEGSVEERFGTQRLLAGVFRSRWTDLVAAQDLSDAEIQAAIARGALAPNTAYAYQDRNLSRITSYGINAAYDGSVDLGRVRYGVTFTEAYARLEEPGTDPAPLAVNPVWFGNARVSYDLQGEAPTIGIATRVVGRRLTDRGDGVYAKPQFELRGTVTGPVPGLTGLSYGLTANWMLRDRSPYGVSPPVGDPVYVPYDRFRTMVVLRYDLAL